MPIYDKAAELIEQGIVILPAKNKAPTVKWTKYQETPPSQAEYRMWFNKKRDLWMLTGSPSGIVVLDIDNEEAAAYWRSILGDVMDMTTRVETKSGFHLWWRLEPGSDCRSWSQHNGVVSFDVRGDGGGVMVPPSSHPGGGFYSWTRDLSHLEDAPSALFPSNEEGSDLSVIRSMLTDLLRHPPTSGGRNLWLTKVAGHLASYLPFEDAYLELAHLINGTLEEPLPSDEVEKTLESVWRTEKHKPHTPVGNISWEASSGFLFGLDGALYTLTGKKDEEGTSSYEPECVGNFDVAVIGKIREEGGGTAYRCNLTVGDRTIPITLRAADFATTAHMNHTLFGYGCCIYVAKGDLYSKTPFNNRLFAYVAGQPAPDIREVSHLGWNDGIGYVTHDGVLTATQVHSIEESGIAPKTNLIKWAPYSYGTGNRATALAILQEVMTFHEERVCSLFGSWWAACVLKAQITQITSLFPFVAIEAASESGKTTGFFSLMVQLNGSKEGHGEYTTAALRDRVSAHRNGIVWMDDITDTYSVFEIIRQTTAEGSRSKKGNDNHDQDTVRMLSPVVITAESMEALSYEKALKDRAILIPVSSPVNRRSIRSEGAQWDDIIDLKTRYPDLTKYAGDLVMEVLKCESMIDDLPNLRIGNGRNADKLAIMRLGARILAKLTGNKSHIEYVDKWAEEEAAGYDPSSNHLMLRILPEFLSNAAIMQRSSVGGPAVFITEDNRIAYSEPRLAAWWAKHVRNPRDLALGTVSSLKLQRTKMAVDYRRLSVLASRKRGEADQQVRYWILGEDDSRSCAAIAGISYCQNDVAARSGAMAARSEDQSEFDGMS